MITTFVELGMIKFKQGIRPYINLALFVVLVSSLVYILGFGLSLYLARQEVTTEVNNKVRQEIDMVNNYVDGQLQRVEDVAYTLVSSRFGASARNSRGEGYVVIDPKSFTLPTEEQVFVELERFLDTNPHICGVAIGFENFVYPHTDGQYGFAAYVTNVSGRKERLPLGHIHDFHKKEWYCEAAQQDKPYWSRPFRETHMGKVVTCFSLPLHGFNNRLVGVLALDIDTENFRDKCNEASPLEGSEVTIMDREYRFVSHPEADYILKKVSEVGQYRSYTSDDNIKAVVDSQKTGDFTITKEDDSESFFFVSPIKRNGWTIAIECPKDKVYGGVDRMKRDTTIIAAVSVIFMLLSMVWIFRRLQIVTTRKAGMESELKIASGIQKGMTQKSYPSFPDRTDLDVYGFIKPAKSVGGDLFDYFVRDEKLFFCIGDVSGKGIPASLFMTVSLALFRYVAMHHDDPATIMASLNDVQSKRNTHCMFCTMFLGVLDLKTGKLSYCNGGHNAPVLRRLNADGHVEVNYMDVKTNIAVGLMEGFEYVGDSLILAPGEALFLYTDGVTEAENINKELFGERATLDALAKARRNEIRSAKDFVDYVYGCIEEHAHGNEQSDDITMLVVEYKGA